MRFRFRGLAALVVVVGFALNGCSAMRERRWSYCAVGGGLLGAAVGAGAAGSLVYEYEGDTGGSDEETAAAAAGAAVGGAVVGTLLGHMICDPQKEAPPLPVAPPPPAPKPLPKKISLSADTFFDFDSAKLRPLGEQRVEELVQGLKENPSVRVLVEGHTDSIGTEKYNQVLSERRANAVRDYMVSRGIDASRISTRGYGELKPIASNKTAEGRAKNRRVDITTL
jgi:OOP family OmpA-OmpF porin